MRASFEAPYGAPQNEQHASHHEEREPRVDRSDKRFSGDVSERDKILEDAEPTGRKCCGGDKKQWQTRDPHIARFPHIDNHHRSDR